MLQIVKANTKAADFNRDLILGQIEAEAEQSKVSATLMRQVATSVSELATALEAQQAATEQRVEEMAAALNQEADNAIRQRAGNALRKGATTLTDLITKLRGNT